MTAEILLLGFTTHADSGAVGKALAGVNGPAIVDHRLDGAVCFGQHLGKARGRRGLAAQMAIRHLRSERAGLAGAYLPADPAGAACPARDLSALLAGQGPAIARALAQYGHHRQWDLVVSWPAERLLAPHRAHLAECGRAGRAALAEAVAASLAASLHDRAARLSAALAPAVLACAPLAAGETSCGLTLLLPPGGIGRLETVLAELPPALSDDASADLRGPMPAVSFLPVRMQPVADMQAAWRALQLPDAVTPRDLQTHWRAMARRLHPDAGGDPRGMASASAAFRLIQAAQRRLPKGALATLASMAAPPGLIMPELPQ